MRTRQKSLGLPDLNKIERSIQRVFDNHNLGIDLNFKNAKRRRDGSYMLTLSLNKTLFSRLEGEIDKVEKVFGMEKYIKYYKAHLHILDFPEEDYIILNIIYKPLKIKLLD